MKIDNQGTLASETTAQRGECAVVDHAAVVDQHHARAQALDIGQVMRRQDHRHAALAVDIGQKMANALLGDDVKADRGLVKEKEPRLVQQRRGQIGAHALPER